MNNHSVNSNNDNIIEDKPKFRSVAFDSRPFQPRISTLFKGKSNIIEPCKGMRKEQQGKTRWAVINAKSIPYFGLVKGSVSIDDIAMIISARIDESLRLRSVEAKFDVDCAEAICKTSDFLKYKICLYSGPDDNSTHMEVIRLQGCGLAFRKERQAIINAAKGLGGNPVTPKVMQIPAELRSLYTPPSSSHLENVLDRACDHFHSRNRHNVLFALQNLASITNADKTHTETAHKMSMLIMENKSNARDLIVSIYTSEAKNMSDDISEQICNSALCILTHGLISLSRKDGYLDRECKHFTEQLLPCLTRDVESCKCTHNACLALRCFYLLISNSSIAYNNARENNVFNVLAQAERYGSAEHLKLERVARSTIEILKVN
jgi:hypothetical protein